MTTLFYNSQLNIVCLDKPFPTGSADIILSRQNHRRRNRADTSRLEHRTSRSWTRYGWLPVIRYRRQTHTVQSCHSTSRCGSSIVQTGQPSHILAPRVQSARAGDQSKVRARGRVWGQARVQVWVRARVQVWVRAKVQGLAFRVHRPVRRREAFPVRRRGNENHQA